MFGIFRYMLAFCVAISHLWAGMIGGPAAYAVWGFYCLSGFLMALILNEKYGFSAKGFWTFAVNRVLRIFPAYYAVCLGMVVLFLTIPSAARAFLPYLGMPANLQGWLFTITLLTPMGGGELVHGSSALRVELWHYVFMAVGLARSRKIVVAWFCLALFYVGSMLYHHVGFTERYVYLSSCSLAFSFGALIYHFRDWLPVIRSPWPAVVAILTWWLHVWVSLRIPGGPWIVGLYTSLLASAFVIVTLMRLDSKSLSSRLVAIDRLAGNLSYPIYLAHWGVGVSVSWLLGGLSRENPVVFLMAYPIVNLVGYGIYRLVEKPIQAWKLPSLVRSPAAAEPGLGLEPTRRDPAATISPAPPPHFGHALNQGLERLETDSDSKESTVA